MTPCDSPSRTRTAIKKLGPPKMIDNGVNNVSREVKIIAVKNIIFPPNLSANAPPRIIIIIYNLRSINLVTWDIRHNETKIEARQN